MSHVAFRLAKMRVKRRNTKLLCPACFKEKLEGLSCRHCGAELDQPPTVDEVPQSSSPVHSVQPLRGLGSMTPYDQLRLQYGGSNIKHLVEAKPRRSLLERCKSDLWQELKEVMPPDGTVEEASRLLAKEVREFESRYPALVGSKHVRTQLVGNVVALMALRYPALRNREKAEQRHERAVRAVAKPTLGG